MFKTLKRWLGFKDKEAEALVKLLETSSNDAKVGNTISGEEMLAKLKDQPPKAPTTRSVRGDRRPPEPPPAPPMRTHHVTRSAPDPYYNTVLNNPILFVDVPAREHSVELHNEKVDVTNEFKVTPYEAPAARQEPASRPEPYFVEPDRSYESSRDCGSYDSSSSSDSCSSSFD